MIYPEIPSEAIDKMTRRDELRTVNPQDPQIHELNREIDQIINKHKREKWRETVENKKCDTTKLYKLINVKGQRLLKTKNIISYFFIAIGT